MTLRLSLRQPVFAAVIGALGVFGMATPPAQAGSEEVARVLAGVAAATAIGIAIKELSDNNRPVVTRSRDDWQGHGHRPVLSTTHRHRDGHRHSHDLRRDARGHGHGHGHDHHRGRGLGHDKARGKGHAKHHHDGIILDRHRHDRHRHDDGRTRPERRGHDHADRHRDHRHDTHRDEERRTDHRTERRQEHRDAHRSSTGVHIPHTPRPLPDYVRQRALPQSCLIDLTTHQGRITGYMDECLRRHYDGYATMPRSCGQVVHRSGATIYPQACLENGDVLARIRDRQ